jgi:thioredoxin 1
MATQDTLTFTDANFRSEVLQSDRPVLVDFWAAWCGPCRALTSAIERLAREQAGSARVGKLNVDDSPETAAQYGVQSIPTVLVFRGGKVVGKLVGVQPKERYEQLLAQAQAVGV